MSKGLKPFFTYYGGKWRTALHYPEPRYDWLIETFAGSAGYAIRYYKKRVRLYELDEKVYGVWDYLIKVKREEVMRLPAKINHVDEMKGCHEAKWLVGFWLNKASSSPCLTPSTWMRSGIRPHSYWGQAIKERIASQVGLIKHWTVGLADYRDIGWTDATWFVDPPYSSVAGRIYRKNIIDYSHLAEWCKTRRGQVIVCEAEGASWLPFEMFRTIKSTEGSRGKKQSKEVVWYRP